LALFPKGNNFLAGLRTAFMRGPLVGLTDEELLDIAEQVRADAVAVRGEERLAVLDWKSDISPSREDRSGHIAQLKDYVETIGAPKGAIVYMSLGEVVWMQPRATTSIA
jgi:hypothetical protein